MRTPRLLVISCSLLLGLCGAAFAKVDCSDVKNKNQDECVRAKVNNNSGNVNCSDVKNKNQDECVRAKANNNAGNVNCSDVKNKNRDECVRMKANKNDVNVDDVNCSNAKDADVRQACRKAKY